MKKRVLITGVAGFLGYHTAKFLLAKGFEVIGVDNLSSNYDPEVKFQRLNELGIFLTAESDLRIHPIHQGAFTFYKADILQDEFWAVLKPTYPLTNLIHYANPDFQSQEGWSAKELSVNNFKGFVQVIDCAKSANVQQLIYVTPLIVPKKNNLDYEELYFLSQASHSINEFWAFTAEENHEFESISLDVPLVFGKMMSPMHPLTNLNLTSSSSNYRNFLEGIDLSLSCCPVVGYTSSLLELMEGKIQATTDSKYSIAEDFCIGLDEYQEMMENFSS